jgi:hypothetical protein
MANAETEALLRKDLAAAGYELSDKKGNGITGVDIIATKGKEEIFIEVIGYKRSNPSHSRDFFESFFRAISRLNDHASKIVIALPISFKAGFPQRVK